MMDKYANQNINRFFLHLVNCVILPFAEFNLLNRNVFVSARIKYKRIYSNSVKRFDSRHTLNRQERTFHIL